MQVHSECVVSVLWFLDSHQRHSTRQLATWDSTAREERTHFPLKFIVIAVVHHYRVVIAHIFSDLSSVEVQSRTVLRSFLIVSRTFWCDNIIRLAITARRSTLCYIVNHCCMRIRLTSLNKKNSMISPFPLSQLCEREPSGLCVNFNLGNTLRHLRVW